MCKILLLLQIIIYVVKYINNLFLFQFFWFTQWNYFARNKELLRNLWKNFRWPSPRKNNFRRNKLILYISLYCFIFNFLILFSHFLEVQYNCIFFPNFLTFLLLLIIENICFIVCWWSTISTNWSNMFLIRSSKINIWDRMFFVVQYWS